MLMLQAEKMGYDIPVWGTFDRITNLNYIKDKHGNVFQARDENNNKLPQVSVNKGEKSFPVFLTTFTSSIRRPRKRSPMTTTGTSPRRSSPSTRCTRSSRSTTCST